MKLLKKLVNNSDITLNGLKEIRWCCVNYQRNLPAGEDCIVTCPACKDVSLTRCCDRVDNLCKRCAWRLIKDFKIPEELQEYSYIYNLKSKEDRKAHPDFQIFFSKLKEKFEALCEKANRALRRCHGEPSKLHREYCSNCPLQEVCIQI